MPSMVDEIRINSQFAQLLQAEYSDGLGEDSKPIIRKSVTNTSEYLKKMSTQLDNTCGVLPPNCRYLEKTSNGSVVVIEEPPAFRTIKVSFGTENEIELLKAAGKIEEYGIDKEFYTDQKNRPYPFTLAFPYVIFIMVFDRYNSLLVGQAYLRSARLAGLSDYLLKIPMMNINREQNICYGSRSEKSYETLNAAVEGTIMVFWSAVFNQDFTYNYSEYKEVAGVNTYLGWQALSQIDPMFIYSVEWIDSGKSLSDVINHLKLRHHLGSVRDVKYRELANIFTQPCDFGKEEPPHKTLRRKEKLYYDIAQGIYLNAGFYIHVGDPIIWGKGNAFIDSFIGFFASDRIRIVRIDLGDKLICIRFTNKVREYLLQGAKKLRFEETGQLKNGVTIKENDIIVIKDSYKIDRYRKVFFIRKTRDGITEAKIGDSFYILENLTGNVLDMEAPTLNNIQLKKGEKYLLVRSARRTHVPYISANEVEYDKVDTNHNGELTFNFYGTNTDYSKEDQLYRVKSSSPREAIFKVSDFDMMPPVFRVGRNLYKMFPDDNGKTYAWTSKDGVVIDNTRSSTQATAHDIETFLLYNHGSTLYIPSYDMDLIFNIGDKVVCADWKDPINMLITKTITAFKLEYDSGCLSFVLSDKNGNLSEVPYIISEKSNSVVLVGKIRKITNEYGRVVAGTKIIAQKGYIPHFPKKDVNIIIGFITDTGGEPLVLCSNCCTLWFSDMMENFKRVTMKSKKWVELQHASIDINKIKFQPGDILNGTRDLSNTFGWVVIKDSLTRTVKLHPLSFYTRNNECYTFDNYMRSNLILDCIPNPRISQSEQSRIDCKQGFPNFHGLVNENPKSQFCFMDDGRSIVNV